MRVKRVKPAPGQESVWDYPRPPRVEKVDKPIQIIFAGEVIAHTTNAKRVLETSHPPVYYLPPEDVALEYLTRNGQSSFCEWKGQALYYSLEVKGRQSANAAWAYLDLAPGYEDIQDHLAFYAGPLDSATVDGEEVEPQPGRFYGGWITEDIVGPFKGGPGTIGW